MRISSLQAFNIGVNGIKDVSSQSLKTQQQMATGQRVLTPADDPVAAARILQMEQEQATRSQYMKNIDSVENRLQLEEGQLDSVSATIARVRELTLQAGNGSYTKTDRQAIAKELEVRLDELADLMNSRDANGEYIFSGFKGNVQPFAKTDNGSYVYQGDDGQRLVQVASTTKIPVSDSGFDLFVDIPSTENTFYTYANPNNTSNPPATITQGLVEDQAVFDGFYPEDFLITFNDPNAVAPPAMNYTVTQKSDGRVLLANQAYSEGSAISVAGLSVVVQGTPNPNDSFLLESSSRQSLLTTVGRLVEGLDTLGNDQMDALNSLLDTTVANLDNAQTRLLEVRAQIGGRLNTLDSTRSLQSQLDITSQKILSDLQDLDYAEAASRLSFETFVLQAAQQSYMKVANLSLFNFI